MRWHDYFLCTYFADLISAGLVHSNMVLLFLGALSYIVYENFRKRVPR
jgi:hypothetical protein